MTDDFAEMTFLEACRGLGQPFCHQEMTVFTESAPFLDEARAAMTSGEFDQFCTDTPWIGGSAAAIVPYLDARQADEVDS